MSNKQTSSSILKNTNFLLLLGLLLYLTLLIRTAWLCDDSYITMRVVNNFVNGYGLRWNTFERVQVYTHPLWMFLLSFVYFFTRESYFTLIFVSIFISALAVYFLIFKTSLSIKNSLLALFAICSSKAVIDYSTSGLENPLSYLLIAIFGYFLFKKEKLTLSKYCLLCFIAALATVNRIDTLLLYLPIIFYYGFLLVKNKQTSLSKLLSSSIISFLPLICWEIFALFYYGFLMPNTAYAKLNTGIPALSLIKQGVIYFLDSLDKDPLTLIFIFFSIILAFFDQQKEKILFALGIILYLLYTVKIGGDFMRGRFFAVPFFAAAILLVRTKIQIKNITLPLLFIICLGLLSLRPNLLSNAEYQREGSESFNDNGIADERSYYYLKTGLLKVARNRIEPNHPWYFEGLQNKNNNIPFVEIGSVGFWGYGAGPNVKIVDRHGLCDPLLSRLSTIDKQFWRIGHFLRAVPTGYAETIKTGINKIADQNLSLYYDRLSILTRMPLFSFARIKEIFYFNTGKYSDLIKNYEENIAPISQ